MPIDDPLDALQKQFENEERSTDPVLNRLIHLASVLPLPVQAGKILEKVIAHLGADRIEKIELTLKVVEREIRRHEVRLREISEQDGEQVAERRFREWLALAKDGIERAQRTRARERIERIGKILACSLVAAVPPKPDDVEEMMRVAMDLSDIDIQFLSELVRIQGELLENGRVPRYQAWQSWERGNWNHFADGVIESVFSKLESFGMVTRLAPPNNLTIMADFQNRYSLLEKGRAFVNFIQQ